ncbi:hypothetical protein BS78_01G238500 [Paspalum vaginatum]|nr:hypothetical protein BS78_01G238500 [Paspalum vaginatum]KAJ1295641.1 hypothetical protein BS78_01G238500 [Paspalum vaginatum]
MEPTAALPIGPTLHTQGEPDQRDVSALPLRLRFPLFRVVPAVLLNPGGSVAQFSAESFRLLLLCRPIFLDQYYLVGRFRCSFYWKGTREGTESLQFLDSLTALVLERGNPMGDMSLNQTLINDDPLPLPLPLPGSIAKGDHIQGLLSAGWTDERHSSYISSMEASFVEQFYGQENCGNDATKSHLLNGYKMIQEGVCKNIRFERNSADTRDIGTNFRQENPWLRRFRPRGASVNRGVEPMVDDYGSGTDTVREKVRTHAREVKASVEEKLIGKSKEVTDQNFPDEEIEVSNEPCKKQRPTSGAASNDQGT